MSRSGSAQGAVLTHWEGQPVREWADAWGIPALEAWDVVGSTNDRARAWRQEGARAWSVVVADSQSSGRGRAGRRWVSEPGRGLWFSILLPSSGVTSALVPLRTGLAVAQVLEDVVDAVDLGVKWPNDLWWRDRKVGGILCESRSGETVVGVGVNLDSPRMTEFDAAGVTGTQERPVGVRDISDGEVPRDRLLGALVRRIRDVLGRGGSRLSAAEVGALARRDRLRGRAVCWSEGPGGIARGVAPDGSLQLETPDGIRHIRSGSVRPIARASGLGRNDTNVEGGKA